ncbi:uncharacterized protein P174DRAFT_444311 [Aspergillus novofumigatus IBT 16806]|uniref:Uncharacterized protein n=1 Tax=Aspergillus novofumigatus (strain IBT 16806) TaxID=1392255 RepID=A0A2I1BYS7_ASPN1|nr:uncharacterized protein P174DRAFT_444311 [Aspergillus novofumigatus IBT 16806]PKX90526.1 hypothetical protein P174DRAFT_444311 [Aspergillus novofumigatus IBT 16806]
MAFCCVNISNARLLEPGEIHMFLSSLVMCRNFRVYRNVKINELAAGIADKV